MSFVRERTRETTRGVKINKPYARPGHMVQNHTCWDVSYTVGLPKQRQVKVDCATCVILYHVTGSCKGPNI